MSSESSGLLKFTNSYNMGFEVFLSEHNTDFYHMSSNKLHGLSYEMDRSLGLLKSTQSYAAWDLECSLVPTIVTVVVCHFKKNMVLVSKCIDR